MKQYRVRRKSDGMFFGCREWGKTHSSVGKFYKTANQARAAYRASQEPKFKEADHEIVEYELVEVSAASLSKDSPDDK